MRSSTTEVAEEQDPVCEYGGERPTTPEWTLRRSTRVGRVPLHFEHFITAAIEDPVRMEEMMESSDKEQ